MTGTTRRGFFGILGAALAAVGVGRRGEPQGRVIESFELTGLHVHPCAPREVCRVPGCAMYAIGGGYCRLHGAHMRRMERELLQGVGVDKPMGVIASYRREDPTP